MVDRMGARMLGRGPTATLALTLAASLLIALPGGLLGQDASAGPAASAAAEQTMAPAQALCESADDLRLIVEFLRGTDVDEDGWLPILVGAIAGLSEGRTLAGLAGETYRPLVDDLIVSFQALRLAVDGLDGSDTAGAWVAAVGEAITEIGNAMDALSTELRTPCPTEA